MGEFQRVNTKKDTRRTGPIFHPVTFMVAFGVVLVTPRTGWYVIVDVRVASPLAKPASSQSQRRVGPELSCADDVMNDQRRECLYVTIVPL